MSNRNNAKASLYMNKAISFLLLGFLSMAGISCSSQVAQEVKEIKRDADGLSVDLDPRVKKMALEHRVNVKKINQSFDEERRGDANARFGNYEQALIHYFKALELTVGPKGVIMSIIAETYQKMGRYDDAIAILQESIDTNQWNEEGKTNTKVIIEQLRLERSSKTKIG